eukprot:TRINITY_DN50532_c0_g1_i1.p1 TRINITY_DN50532_c0_g1~~TRINITY_DN50532_c0_g1_i1.p1  ORF type:complete len:144 (+),score=29.95 TRINITY_DN50532_c0_g1_i1:61-432(+)
MDDWTMYQITGDEDYLNKFRNKHALRAGLMGSSMGAIAVLCTSMTLAQLPAAAKATGHTEAWPPKWLPRRIAFVALFAGGLSVWSSYRSTSPMVGQFVIAQSSSGEEPVEKPAAPAAAKDRTL